MIDIDDYIIDFAKQIKKNGLLLSYDCQMLNSFSNAQELKTLFIKDHKKLFNFNNSNNNKKCNAEKIFMFNEHFESSNILVKIPIDTFSVHPIVNGKELNKIFGYDGFDKYDKGIVVVSHAKKIIEFARAIEYDGNIMFLGTGTDIEYAINDKAYDKDVHILNMPNGPFNNYVNFDNDISDFEFVGLHSSIEDYFNMQRSIINLYMEREETEIKTSISNVNYHISGLQSKLARLNSELNDIDAKYELKLSKIDLARVSYDLMGV